MSEKQTRYYTERFRALTRAKNQNVQRTQDLKLNAQQAEEDHERRELIQKLNEALARAMARFDSRDWDGARELARWEGGRRSKNKYIPAMHLAQPSYSFSSQGRDHYNTYLGVDGKLYVLDGHRYRVLLDPKKCGMLLLRILPDMLDATR